MFGNRILLSALVMLSAPSVLAAQSTPEELGDRLAHGIRASDAAALEALIHPATRESLPEGRIRRAVDAWLNQDIGETWTVDVMPATEVDSYDTSTGTYDFGGLTLRFPVEPTHFLQLVIEEEITVRSDGEARRVPARSDATLDGIRRDDGRWWVVLPTLHGS